MAAWTIHSDGSVDNNTPLSPEPATPLTPDSVLTTSPDLSSPPPYLQPRPPWPGEEPVFSCKAVSSHTWAFWGEEEHQQQHQPSTQKCGEEKGKHIFGGEKSPDSLLEDGGGKGSRTISKDSRDGGSFDTDCGQDRSISKEGDVDRSEAEVYQTSHCGASGRSTGEDISSCQAGVGKSWEREVLTASVNSDEYASEKQYELTADEQHIDVRIEEEEDINVRIEEEEEDGSCSDSPLSELLMGASATNSVQYSEEPVAQEEEPSEASQNCFGCQEVAPAGCRPADSWASGQQHPGACRGLGGREATVDSRAQGHHQALDIVRILQTFEDNVEQAVDRRDKDQEPQDADIVKILQTFDNDDDADERTDNIGTDSEVESSSQVWPPPPSPLKLRLRGWPEEKEERMSGGGDNSQILAVHSLGVKLGLDIPSDPEDGEDGHHNSDIKPIVKYPKEKGKPEDSDSGGVFEDIDMEICDPCYCYTKCWLDTVASFFCVSLL